MSIDILFFIPFCQTNWVLCILSVLIMLHYCFCCAFYGGLSWVLTQNKVHGPCSQPVLLQSTAEEPHDHLEEDWSYFGKTAVLLAWFLVTPVAYTPSQWMSCSLFLFGTLSQLATMLCYGVESHPGQVITIIQTSQVSMRSVTLSMQQDRAYELHFNDQLGIHFSSASSVWFGLSLVIR